MADDIPPVDTKPPGPSAKELANSRPPKPLPPSEREVFEAKIEEQKEEIETLRAEIAELKKEPVKAKKKGFWDRVDL